MTEPAAESSSDLVPESLLSFAKDDRYVQYCQALLCRVIEPFLSRDYSPIRLEQDTWFLSSLLYTLLVVARTGKTLGMDALGLSFAASSRRRRVVGALLLSTCSVYLLQRITTRTITTTTTTAASATTSREGRESLRGEERRRYHETLRQQMLQRQPNAAAITINSPTNNTTTTTDPALHISYRERFQSFLTTYAKVITIPYLNNQFLTQTNHW
jgi:hypothetical protein